MPVPNTKSYKTSFTSNNVSHAHADLAGEAQSDYETLRQTIDILFTAARPRLLRLTRMYGVQYDAADDIVQETLLEAWRHIDHLREPGRFDAWLNGICHNICRRWFRSQDIASKYQASLPHLYADQENEPEDSCNPAIADPEIFDPVEELERQDMAILLDRALGYLPQSSREAVELCYLSELPRNEAALQLRMTIHALEERLHRARRQLRQLLNTELRDEAEAFGLALDGETAGWRATREWCRYCGQQHELGLLESRSDGFGHVRTRCPSCSLVYREGNLSGWMPELHGLHSFRPALKRLGLKLKSYMPQALIDGSYPCGDCGKQALIRIVSPNEPYGTFHHPHPQHALMLECPACGWFSSMWAGSAIFWFHPAPGTFTERHPRWIIGPEVIMEYANQPAIRFCLIDVASTAKLFIIADYRTLQVLATYQE